MKPSRSSLTRYSSVSATRTLMRSAIFFARAGSAMVLTLLGNDRLRADVPWRRDEDPQSPLCPGVSGPVVSGRAEASQPAHQGERRSGTRDLAHLVGLDDVANPDVVEATEVDAALEALANLGHVVLETTQTGDLDALADDGTVTEDPRLGAALDLAGADQRTGDVTELGGLEDLAHLGGAQLDLFVLRLEHALERCLDVVDRRVDDRVEAHVHALAFGQVRDPLCRLDVEADDDGTVDRRQVDIVLRDRAHPAVDDPQVDLVADVDLEQRVLERLDRTRHITLEDEVEVVDLARGQSLVEVLEADPLATLGQAGRTLGGFTTLGDLASGAVVGCHQERVTGAGHRGQTEHHDRTRRRGLLDRVAVLVQHGADAAVATAGHDGVTDAKRSGLDQR